MLLFHEAQLHQESEIEGAEGPITNLACPWEVARSSFCRKALKVVIYKTRKGSWTKRSNLRLIGTNAPPKIYLITEFHKAYSWSLGAAGRSIFSLHKRRSAKFKVGEIHEGSIQAEAYSWEATHGFKGRVGPVHPRVRSEVPNQTVFIRGFRITVNKILFLKTISVKTRQCTRFKFIGFGSSVINLLSSGTADSTSSSGAEGSTDNTVDQDFLVNRGPLDTDTRVTVDRMPNVSQVRLSATVTHNDLSCL